MKWPDNNGYTSPESTPNSQLYLLEQMNVVRSIYREPESGAGLLELTTTSKRNGGNSAHDTSDSTANPITAPPITRARTGVLAPMAIACALENKLPVAMVPIPD